MDDATEAAIDAEIVGPVGDGIGPQRAAPKSVAAVQAESNSLASNPDFSDESLAAAHSVLDEKVTSLIPNAKIVGVDAATGKPTLVAIDAAGQLLPPDHQQDPRSHFSEMLVKAGMAVSKANDAAIEKARNMGFSGYSPDYTNFDFKTGERPEKLNPFLDRKRIRFEDGPSDGAVDYLDQMPSDGLICFFCESSPGVIQQAVYKIILKEIEATDEEKAAAKEKNEVLPKRYEWIGEYMGKRRHTPPQNVNGCRKV